MGGKGGAMKSIPVKGMLAAFAVLAAAAPARTQAEVLVQANGPLVTEEAMIDSPQAGQKIYVRNKHAAGMTAFSPERTVVFVHGATYPASTAFDLALGGLSWMDYIAQRGFDVYLLDLPGYGRATRPAAMDGPGDQGQPVESTAQAVADYTAVADWVMARRRLAKIGVMGWSWGTTIAGGYAAAHPDKVNRLVLYAPVWVPQQVGTAEPAKVGAYRTVSAEAAKQRWLNGVPADKQAGLIPPGWFEAWQRATWATDPASGGTTLRAPNGVTDDIQRLWARGTPTYDPARITAPTLMIQAEWDRDTPPLRSQALFPALTHAASKTYVLIGEGTHTVMMEKNRLQFFAAVQSFLEAGADQ
jgi:pimeloyl-ACP methyl ester carboxylesterase